MKRNARSLSALILLAFFLVSCSRSAPEPTTETQEDATVFVPAETESTPDTQPPTTAPAHSSLYLEGLSVEDLIIYFNEVCLDAEIIHSGDPSHLQKWTVPI